MKYLLSALIAIFILTITHGSQTMASRETLIGYRIKDALEHYHYKKQKINDDVSVKAFDQYLKNIDYSKAFLTQAQVKELRKFMSHMDDEIISGKYPLVDKTIEFMTIQVKKAEAIRVELFKKEFNFAKKESIELDPKKRKFAASEKEFKEQWRKTFKSAVLGQYISYIEGQKDENDTQKVNKKKKAKKAKKVKGAKKMTDKEMRAKAHQSISKKYEKLFNRILTDERIAHLEKFYNAIATIYDPHTVYLPPKKKEDFDIDISGSLEGIGAVLQEEGPYIKVVKVVPGGAAWRQKGLEVDDIILMVAQSDGEPVDLVDMRVDDAVRYIRGKKGTEVRLTVKKADGTRKVIPIIRDVVQVDASYAQSSLLTSKKLGRKIGYIHVPKFYRDFGKGDQNCTKDVRDELRRLKALKVDGIILDLRNNGGGALEDARQMSGLFIKEGPIVQIKNHTGKIDVLRDTDFNVEFDGPLIVMINRHSASASEILAAALQDYGRAIVVGGEYSHGKGTVQAILNLTQDRIASLFESIGALKVTIQKFYRITGNSTQYKGVTPDVILPDPLAYLENREQDLEYSLPWDAVKGLHFETWKQHKFDIPLLKKRSATRVKKNKTYKKLQKAVQYYIERKKDTVASLNKNDVLAEDKKNRSLTEKFKYEFKNPDLEVSNYEGSLKSHQKIRKEDEKHWASDFKLRKEEWVNKLQSDIGLEEAMFVMDDMIKTIQGKKLSMVKK